MGYLSIPPADLFKASSTKTAPDVRQFLGIPFTEPPVGDLRFEKPVKKSPNGTVNALSLPNSCMQQFNSNSSTIHTTYETGFLISGGNSEDCLYLSIWAPCVESIRDQQRPLPVLLYVPGGGFTSGGEASLYKVPDKWIQRTQDHIVVIMNYRVNFFGFPNAKGVTNQNAGLLDQRMAVERVHENIGEFDGDPGRITLCSGDSQPVRQASRSIHTDIKMIRLSRASLPTRVAQQLSPIRMLPRPTSHLL